jgi:hypothetical protein
LSRFTIRFSVGRSLLVTVIGPTAVACVQGLMIKPATL